MVMPKKNSELAQLLVQSGLWMNDPLKSQILSFSNWEILGVRTHTLIKGLSYWITSLSPSKEVTLLLCNRRKKWNLSQTGLYFISHAYIKFNHLASLLQIIMRRWSRIPYYIVRGTLAIIAAWLHLINPLRGRNSIWLLLKIRKEG